MSTAAVSNSSLFQEVQSFYQTRQADLKQLGSALQSGDLNGAQQAYKALAVLGEDGPFANSEPFSKSSRVQAFNAIGEALQAGDLTRAQAAFATLTSKSSDAATSSQATSGAVANLSSAQPGSASTTSSAAASASSIYQQLQAYRQQRQADLTQLGKDLQAGDLNSAQQDFNTLSALGQSGPYKSGQPFAKADRDQDFEAIGQALQNGDLAGAQSAFANLESTFGKQSQQSQSAISAYTTNSGTGEIVINVGSASSTSASSASATPELVINLGQGSSSSPSTSSSASPEEVTINLGSGSSGGQVLIDAAQGQNNSSSEPVTINLNPQSNYEIILNLLNPSSTSSSNALSVSA